mmetsp:Transcript_19068/g.53135  ORF Transcript_19068/g.53135 Transcript_19068/m.53135 type:complete len:187 (-) Transcript_19068:1471-2031(-)
MNCPDIRMTLLKSFGELNDTLKPIFEVMHPPRTATSATQLQKVCAFEAFASLHVDGSAEDAWLAVLESPAELEELCSATPCLAALSGSCLSPKYGVVLPSMCACHQALSESECKANLTELSVSAACSLDILFSPSDLASASSLVSDLQAAAGSFCPAASGTPPPCYAELEALPDVCASPPIDKTVA